MHQAVLFWVSSHQKGEVQTCFTVISEFLFGTSTLFLNLLRPLALTSIWTRLTMSVKQSKYIFVRRWKSLHLPCCTIISRVTLSRWERATVCNGLENLHTSQEEVWFPQCTHSFFWLYFSVHLLSGLSCESDLEAAAAAAQSTLLVYSIQSCKWKKILW